jgi:hypothetical protein
MSDNYAAKITNLLPASIVFVNRPVVARASGALQRRVAMLHLLGTLEQFSVSV